MRAFFVRYLRCVKERAQSAERRARGGWKVGGGGGGERRPLCHSRWDKRSTRQEFDVCLRAHEQPSARVTQRPTSALPRPTSPRPTTHLARPTSALPTRPTSTRPRALATRSSSAASAGLPSGAHTHTHTHTHRQLLMLSSAALPWWCSGRSSALATRSNS